MLELSMKSLSRWVWKLLVHTLVKNQIFIVIQYCVCMFQIFNLSCIFQRLLCALTYTVQHHISQAATNSHTSSDVIQHVSFHFLEYLVPLMVILDLFFPANWWGKIINHLGLKHSISVENLRRISAFTSLYIIQSVLF